MRNEGAEILYKIWHGDWTPGRTCPDIRGKTGLIADIDGVFKIPEKLCWLSTHSER